MSAPCGTPSLSDTGPLLSNSDLHMHAKHYHKRPVAARGANRLMQQEATRSHPQPSSDSSDQRLSHGFKKAIGAVGPSQRPGVSSSSRETAESCGLYGVFAAARHLSSASTPSPHTVCLRSGALVASSSMASDLQDGSCTTWC